MKWVVWDEYSVAVCVERGKKRANLGLCWPAKGVGSSTATRTPLLFCPERRFVTDMGAFNSYNRSNDLPWLDARLIGGIDETADGAPTSP